jgi:hypothetical protein
MKKVTYLFGAGASANALPIVTQIPRALDDFYGYIINNRNGNSEVIGKLDLYKNNFDTEERFLISLKSIIEQSKEHQSIDTYAKKLMINGKGLEYGELKFILTCFFIYLQNKNPIDKRYDSFFASLLGTSDNDLANNVRILSWNYDFQFEKAFRSYTTLKTLTDIQSLLSVYPGVNPRFHKPKFSIFKLNGTTALFHKRFRSYMNMLDDFDDTNPKITVGKFMNEYTECFGANCTKLITLSFAWERTQLINEMLELAVQEIIGSEVLVIIGYSIPFFNREIDRKMVAAMAPTLKKIYIQDLNPQTVADSFASIWPENLPGRPGVALPMPTIIQQSTTVQFFLPPEL